MQSKIETQVGLFVLIAIGIFIYMGFQIGAFRLDRTSYASYTVYFKDVGDLSRKGAVKIAGVKVGWVEDLKLISDGDMQAEAKIMVLKKYTLYSDAYAVVRQQGLLGPHYLELIPGDPLLPRLEPGGMLSKPTTEPVMVDELLQKFKRIAENVEEVTSSLKDAMGGTEGKGQMREIFDNLQTTAEKMAAFSDVLDRTLARNEENLDSFLEMGTNVRRLTDKLEQDVFPSFQDSVERISDVFDRDFNRIASRLESTAQALEDASLQARDGLKNVSSIAEKIDEGKGLIGKLVNEDETYRDLKVAVQGLRNYFAKVDRMQLVFDSHFESMHRPAENYEHCDAKGYFDVRIHPNEDHFYQLQLVSSEKGFRTRHDVQKRYLDRDDNVIDPKTLTLTDRDKLEFIYNEELNVYHRNTVKIGLQFGKVFKDIAFRFGLIEGFAGLGMDIDIPFRNDKFRWVTSVEMFDFSGWNRCHDKRPHLKWLNRMYMFRNLYFTFGADDFASKRNANLFIGAGIRFGDDDVKFLLSGLSGAGGVAGGGGGGGNIGIITGSSTVIS